MSWRIHAGHQAGARGRAYRTDVKVAHRCTAPGHGVEVGRFNHLVACRAKVADPLVVYTGHVRREAVIATGAPTARDMAAVGRLLETLLP